ncbi:MAG TPA: hypothetical protein VMD91_07535 [Candidatus Sulfotelmatobacter sp.]|nr:hypothetical protein [Candidatus Sulfotelmatobacter sp.]
MTLLAHIMGIPVEENLTVMAPAAILGIAALIARLRLRAPRR